MSTHSWYQGPSARAKVTMTKRRPSMQAVSIERFRHADHRNIEELASAKQTGIAERSYDRGVIVVMAVG